MGDCTFLSTCLVQVDSETKGLLLLTLNIIAPGTGTLISAFLDESVNLFALLVGTLQLALALLVVGWLWSIMHGYALYVLSCQQGTSVKAYHGSSSDSDDDDAHLPTDDSL